MVAVRFEPIPLHKKKQAPISIRQLSKTKGSQQGELLEVRQLSEIFADLGYETELIDFQDNYQVLRDTVTNNIQQGNLVIVGFAVDRLTGYPSTHYNRDNEHVAVVHGFNNESGELDVTHWNKHRKTTIKDLYDSSMVLLKQRNPEYYVNIKYADKSKKYDLYTDQTGHSLPTHHKKSLIPTANSGFRGKLVVIKQPKLEHIHKARLALLNAVNLMNLFAELKLKIDELIDKGSEKNKHHRQYKEVSKVAMQLNDKLNDANKQLTADPIKNLERFKQQCVGAIEAAEPEFKKHRGWHKISLILRSILGVLATITVIPAIVVAVATKQGYLNTFFKTPKTDSEEKLASAKQGLKHIFSKTK